jgi:alkylhydroperoxidase family enzyme
VQLEGILDFETGPFDEKEKAALAYAKQLTLDAHAIDDAMFARLREHYDEGEIVEISAMAGLFNYFNRVNDALGMEPTKPGEGL